MGFLKLWWERGVYSRVTAGMALQNTCLFSEFRTPIYFEVHLRNLFEAWQANRDASQGEAGDPGSLSRCHSDIGIPINFQEESGIVTF